METLKSVLRSFYHSLKQLLLFGTCYFLFWHFGHFREIQSILLAVLAGIAVTVARWTEKREKRNKFEPFYIRVEPKWYFILKDHGLIDDEGWKRIQDVPRPGDKSEYRLLYDGITITVLSPTLYYSHNYKSFFSKLNITEAISEVLPKKASEEDLLSFTPQFYVKLVLDEHPQHSALRCIQFGLVTKESLRRSVHVADDRCNIPIATLPDAIFNGYYSDENFALNEKIKDDDIDKLLTHYGWKREKRDDDDYFRNWPDEIEHKYFTVSYNGI